MPRKLILFILAAVPIILLFAEAATAQDITDALQEEDGDVLRINTSLVQTNVTVVDRQGKFVDGLKKEDFELKVDGKPVEVTFFERVVAGTLNEEAQLAAAGGTSATLLKTGAARPLSRGRVIAFFIDDIHISAGNLKRAKDAITKFIEKELGPNDLVAITSATGQVGFLQQFTDNREVLKAALARLNYKNFDVGDMLMPPLSLYQALQIDRGEIETLNFLIEETMRDQPRMPRDVAETVVRGRVTYMLRMGARNSSNTLSTLESLIRYSAPIPGRKLVFFISDGFYLDTRTSSMTDKMRSIVDASTRSGATIYSMDAKGLVTTLDDPKGGRDFDYKGRRASTSAGELTAAQDTMNALAADTGGRFIRDNNDLNAGLTDILNETSTYYLLAWRPETETQRGGKFHQIEVSVRENPSLSVRVQRGFFGNAAAATAKKDKKSDKKSKKKMPEDPVTQALVARYPQRGLPTELTLSYLDAPNNVAQLVASMKIEGSRVRFENAGGKEGGIIDIEGVVFDSQGKRLDGFRSRLVAPPPPSTVTDPKLPDVTYNFYSSLKPGLYQVRVAARYEANGQTGSAIQWVQIPDLRKQSLSLSSLILGERKLNAAEGKKENEEIPPETVPISVDRRFERSSNLRFLVYIYNAARAAAAARPDVELQVRVLRGDDQPVATAPMRKLSTESQDLARLAYAAEIPLQEMTAGQYILQVTAIDRIAKTSASQRIRFEVQ